MNESQRFIRFAATGGLAAAVNVGSRWLLGFLMPFEASVAVAFLIGMTVAFVLARAFVFDRRGDPRAQFVRFGVVNALSFPQVWLISVGLAELMFPAIGLTWNADTIAHAIAVGSPVVTSYVLHKRFSFRQAAG